VNFDTISDSRFKVLGIEIAEPQVGDSWVFFQEAQCFEVLGIIVLFAM
jgi:hypothetical protein